MYIYIACPYTKGDTAVNVRNSILAEERLREMGHTPYNPLYTHFHHMMIPHDYEYWLKLDMEWLDKCDAVFRLPGESNGADFEVERAKEMGMPIFFTYEELESWED